MSPLQKIPVLAYHSHRIAGTTYVTNDHISLAHDLRTIHEHGYRIIPLRWVAAWAVGQRQRDIPVKAVGISFDDGADADYYDCVHPDYGPQRSFYNMLRDFQAEIRERLQPFMYATRFVIASPLVRRELDARCLARIGLRGMTDGWWKVALESGLAGIENHSWDHNHREVSWVCEDSQRKGSFASIDTYAESRSKIQQAATFIHARVQPDWPQLFAYPWGQSSSYLREHCLPQYQSEHRTQAAFGSTGGYVTQASSRWNLAPFVSGSQQYGWTTSAELGGILDGTFIP